MLWDDTFCILSGLPSFRPTDIALAEEITTKSENHTELTSFEREISVLWALIRKCVKHTSSIGDKDQSNKSRLAEILATVEFQSEKICFSDVDGMRLLSSDELQKFYLMLDVLIACVMLLRYNPPKANSTGQALGEILNKAEIESMMYKLRKTFQQIRINVENRKVKLINKEKTFEIKELLISPLDENFQICLGSKSIVSYISMYLESARDALNCVLLVLKIQEPIFYGKTQKLTAIYHT